MIEGTGPSLQIVGAAQTASDSARVAQLRAAAEEFEATFLAEMLKSAGFGQPRGSFGGGAGEDAFASLLVKEQATQLAAGGGIGLSEHIFRALVRADGVQGVEDV